MQKQEQCCELLNRKGNTMKGHSVKMLALASAVVLCGGLGARASVDMTFSWDQTYYQAGYTATDINGSDAIGIYHFTTSAQDGVPNPYWSVCVRPAGLLDGGLHTYNSYSFSEANPGIYPSAWAWGVDNKGVPQYWGINNAAYLWSQYGMGIVNNPGTTGNQRAAALEFAVWTALYDSTGYGQLGGAVWSAPTGQMGSASDSNSTLYWYNTYVTALTGPLGPTHAVYTGNILESTIAGNGSQSGGSQEFLLLGTPIPEPTTMIAGALLLLPFGASTLRILRRGRAA